MRSDGSVDNDVERIDGEHAARLHGRTYTFSQLALEMRDIFFHL